MYNRSTTAYYVTWQYDGFVESIKDVNSVIDHVASWVDQPVFRISLRLIDKCCNVNVLKVLHAVCDADSPVDSGAVVRHCCNTVHIQKKPCTYMYSSVDT